jgi:hypothetical protein
MSRSPIALFVFACIPSLEAAENPFSIVSWDTESTIAPGERGHIARLPGGGWVAVTSSSSPSSRSALAIHRSADGKTWSAASEVSETERELRDPSLAILPGGECLLTARSMDEESYRLPVYRSADGGRTWKILGTIETTEKRPGIEKGKGVWEPSLLVLGPRKVAAFYTDETHAKAGQVITERVSLDGGTTWGDEIRVAADTIREKKLRPSRPVAARLPDGKVLAVYEVAGDSKSSVFRKVSKDGISWEKGLGARIRCHRVAPCAAAMPDGRIFLTSSSGVLSASADGGDTWVKLNESPWGGVPVDHWPALLDAGAGRIAALMASGGEVKLRLGKVGPPIVWPDTIEDRFDDASAPRWTVYAGSAEVTEGGYLLRGNRKWALALTGSTSWADGIIEVDITLKSEGNAGLVCRVLNGGDENADSFCGYYLHTGWRGGVFIGMMMDGVYKHVAAAPANVGLGEKHRLRVRMAGKSLQVFLDDLEKAKIEITDTAFRRGQVGLRAFGCDALFDDFSFRGEPRAPR